MDLKQLLKRIIAHIRCLFTHHKNGDRRPATKIAKRGQYVVIHIRVPENIFRARTVDIEASVIAINKIMKGESNHDSDH